MDLEGGEEGAAGVGREKQKEKRNCDKMAFSLTLTNLITIHLWIHIQAYHS